MKKARIYIGVAIGIIIIITLYFVFNTEKTTSETIQTKVKFGEFQIKVTTTGELEAKNSEKIYGPRGLREFRIWEIKIEDIIPDGTVVDSGQYVASLDKTELANKIKDKELDVDQYTTQFIKIQLDTTLELRQARNELINLEYNLEERQITVDQSIYEPPATQRQANIDLEKAKRSHSQAISNYKIRRDKKIAEMQEVSALLRKAKQEYQDMKDLESRFRIYAPKSGMVIYRRKWDGQKQGIGSSVGVWDPVVAELPDLTQMISKTYVNEIDISKAKVGQFVEIGVDAFPDENYTGRITEVANIGEQLKNSNTKVFEVIIEIFEYDPILRPSMTTKNTIITDNIDSVLFLPLECINSNDSMSYVYTRNNKKQVILGRSNENEVIIKEGLEKGDQVYLRAPEDAEEYNLELLDPEIVSKYNQEEKEDSLKSRGPRGDKKKFMRRMSMEQIEKMQKEGNKMGQGNRKKPNQ